MVGRIFFCSAASQIIENKNITDYLSVSSPSLMLAWLRMKSGTIWSAVIFHTTHNGVIQSFFDLSTANTGSTKYFTGEFGSAMVPLVAVSAWYFLKR